MSALTDADRAEVARVLPHVQVWCERIWLNGKAAGRAEAAADTARLDFVIRWLGTHDTLDCVRDWNDAADARAAIDAALAAK